MKGEPKRRALGRGLSSLIPDAVDTGDALRGVNAAREARDARESGEARDAREPGAAAGQPVEIEVDAIRPNPRQPRRHFRDEEIASLAESIRQSGILQPLLVRAEPGGSYTLIAGERRLRAAQRIGLTTVPAILRDAPDDRLLELALIENLQRDDLGPLETAKAFRTLVRDLGLTQNEAAERVGKPRSTVANFLRLLDLPEVVQNLLDDGSLDMGHGRALAGLDDPASQEKIAIAAAANRWSVREIEARVKRAALGGEDVETPLRRDPNVVAAEKTLARALEAGVTIHLGRNGRGRIEIRFAGDDDLDRLYRALLRASGKPQP